MVKTSKALATHRHHNRTSRLPSLVGRPPLRFGRLPRTVVTGATHRLPEGPSVPRGSRPFNIANRAQGESEALASNRRWSRRWRHRIVCL